MSDEPSSVAALEVFCLVCISPNQIPQGQKKAGRGGRKIFIPQFYTKIIRISRENEG